MPPDAQLHRLVAREVGLLLGADRVDVAGLGQRRQADLELAGALEQLVDEEPGPALALLLDDLVERGDPVVGLGLGSMSGSWCLNSSKYMSGLQAAVSTGFDARSDGAATVSRLEHRSRAAGADTGVLATANAARDALDRVGVGRGDRPARKRRPSTWTSTAGSATASRYQRAAPPLTDRTNTSSSSTTIQMIVRWRARPVRWSRCSISSVSASRSRSSVGEAHAAAA